MTTLAEAFAAGVRWRERQNNNGIVRDEYITVHNPYSDNEPPRIEDMAPGTTTCDQCGHPSAEHIEGGCLVCDCQALEDRTAGDAAVQAERAEQRAKGYTADPYRWPYSSDPANAKRCGEAYVGYEGGEGSCEYLPNHPGRHWSARWGSWSL